MARRPSRATHPWLAGAVVALALLAPAAARAQSAVGWGTPVYVDRNLAGGEPLVLADARHGTLVYTSHEGTSHLYRPGLLTPATLTDYIAEYRNQVNIWTSTDDGATWKRVDFGAGFFTDPTKNTGFSDPDLSQDDGGRIYDTGINLANDALFSSQDGGFTWDKGTAYCHDGDRPWLAAGHPDEVFMATDASESALGHEIFVSTDGGNSCSTTGAPDNGTLPDGNVYTGYGKLLLDRGARRLVEPVLFCHPDPTGACSEVYAIGASSAPASDDPSKITFSAPVKVADDKVFGHFPVVTQDRSGTMYLVWDDDPRADPSTTGGCSGAPTPLPNHIRISYSKDGGRTWSAPVNVTAPPSARVFWPWAVAGDAGRLSVVYYQTDRVVDVDCATDAKISIREARITGADTASPQIAVTDPVGAPIHTGGVCQGGTTCVATGQDRRLGDFFTNALDADGCVLIASGDDRLRDPTTGGDLATSRPLFIRQDAGPPLIGSGDCARTRGAAGSASSPSSVPCRPSIGFGTVSAHPSGRGVRFVVRRRRNLPFHVEIFQTSHGRTLLRNRLVRSLRKLSGSFTWDGRGAGDGTYFARLVMDLPHRKPDVRRVTLERRGGRFLRRPSFYGTDSCATLGSFKLFEPVFGGRSRSALGIAFRLTRVGRVALVVRRGAKVVARFPAQDRRPGVTYRLSVPAARLARGFYRVTITATSRGHTQRRVLRSRRL